MAHIIKLLGLVFSVYIVSPVPSYSRMKRTISSSEDLPNNETVLREVVEDSRKNLLRLEEYSSRLKNSVIDPIFTMDRYPPSQVDRKVCQKPAKCVPLNYTTCIGTKLPYSQTTLDLVEGVNSQEEGQEHLQIWRGLVHLPKCWAVIQPLLCALYMPKCDGDRVDLPSHEMCKMIMIPCRILIIEHGWPSFLKKCENQTEFPHGCKNDVRELKFNTTGRCKEPMVQTDYPSSYYDGVEGCGVQCDNPLFTLDERNQIHRLVAWAATACFLFNFFTVVTFMIDWRSASKYPALVIFYINFCFLIVCVGWLAQFLPSGREDIVCRKDGTLRVGEPSAGENLSCVVVFVLVYYFLMAGIVWFVILTYAWHISFQALGKIQERMDKKGAYFHLVAWSLPLVLTITTMALGEIDGNSVSGVCFVGTINHVYRASFLLVPVFAALTVGGYFLSKALITLIRLKISSQEIISERASAKIRETIVRMGFFSLLIFTFGITTFVCHIHEFRHSASWRDSFRKYIVCRLGVTGTEPSECRMETRPSLAILQLHLLALFATGIVMSSWVWTSSTVDTWTRFLRRITKKEVEEPVKVKKHKVIARAFAKRKMLNSTGRVSISIHNTYQDPVGLNFELNSLASGELSSTWANALPKLVTRRGALVGIGTNSNSSQRRNSIDSEISYSVRRVSVESRRHSLDSAVSVQVAELTQTVRKASRPSHRVRNKRSRRNRENRHKGSAGGISSCRWSTTSQESQLGAQILSALSIGKADLPPMTSMVPNLKRRTANAGLDDSLNILAGKLFSNISGHLGFNLPSGSGDSSKEEEEVECKGETRETKAGESDNSEESESDEKDGEESGKEEKRESEEEKEPLKSSRRDTESRMSKGSAKSRRKSSLLFDDINTEDGRRSSKRRDTDSRNSKLSDRSDRSRHSKRTIDSENETRRNNRRNREKKWEGKNCPSGGSDMENCTDDVKWIQSEGEGRNSSLRKVSIGVTTDSSFCPELFRLNYQSSPGASMVGYPYQGREIGTQTSVSIDNSEHSVGEEVSNKTNKKKHKTKTTNVPV